MDTETKSDWTENQKGLIKYLDPERYEKIWGVKEVVKEVAGEAAQAEQQGEPEPEPETKKEEEPAAE